MCTYSKKISLVLVILGLAACGKIGKSDLASGDQTSPSISDKAPTELPTTITASAWTGKTSLSSSDLTGKLQGQWLSPCIAGYAQGYVFEGSSVKESYYTYGDASCSKEGRVTGSFTYTVEVTGSDLNRTDGYDLTFHGTYNGLPFTTYQLIKISPSGTLMGFSDKTGVNDGSTIAKRPNTYYPATYIKTNALNQVAPTTFPTAQASSAWSGQAGLSSDGFYLAMQGLWQTACQSGTAIVDSVSGDSVMEVMYHFSDASCTTGAQVIYSSNFRITYQGVSSTPAGGYNILIPNVSSAYQVMKLTTGKYTIGDNSGLNDGTTSAKRPVAFVNYTYFLMN